MENRAKLLDIASFMDRIDRYEGADKAREDFRYRSLLQALETLAGIGADRTKAVQLLFSDPTTEPIRSAVGLIAFGAWKGVSDESH